MCQEMSLSLVDDLRRCLRAKRITLSEADFTTFAANVLLVQNGARLAYRVDVGSPRIRPLLLRAVLERDPSLARIYIPVDEPLLVLRQNKANVKNILRMRPDETGVAAVLGYTYRGKDFWFGDRYLIAYTLRYQTAETSLYSFTIPMCKYNNTHRNQILHNLGLYNTSLHGTGFQVEVCCFVLCTGQNIEAAPLPSLGC